MASHNTSTQSHENQLDIAVGDTAPIVEFEGTDNYGRIVVERTPPGDPDKLKLQTPDNTGDDPHHDTELIAEVGRWISRGVDWTDLPDSPNPDHHSSTTRKS